MLTEHPQGTSPTVINKTDVVLVLMEFTSGGKKSTFNHKLTIMQVYNFKLQKVKVKDKML